jgi:hypothetical protein
MSDDEMKDAYVAALTFIRDHEWPEIAPDYELLRRRASRRDDYVADEWSDLQRTIFDAMALAILEIRRVRIGDAEPPPMVTALARPVSEAQATWLARERYWAGSHARFHQLWTREIGTEGYVKAEWRALDGKIVAAIAGAIVRASGGVRA